MSNIIKLPPHEKEGEVQIDPNAFSTMGRQRGWHINELNIERVHRLTQGEGIKVGVIDTGLDKGTIEVQKSLVKYIDVTGEGTHCPSHVYHGTHVSTTIVGHRNIYGVAPKVKLFHVKGLRNSGSGTSSDIAQGVDILIEEKVDIINMSLGSDSLSRPIKNAITRATNAGILVVCAAGNDGKDIDYPAALPNTIGVAAVGFMSGEWFIPSFTSPSKGEMEVNVAAPGVMIKAVGPRKNGKEVLIDLSGTSMASPIITGVLALMSSYTKVPPLELVLGALKATSYIPMGFDPRVIGAGIIQPEELIKFDPNAVRPSCDRIHPYLEGVNNLFWNIFK